MLANLDILEEYPKIYTRRQESIIINDPNSESERTIEAWIYFLIKFRDEMLDLPYLDNYSTRGPHNLPYLCSYRDPSTIDEHRGEIDLVSSDLAS